MFGLHGFRVVGCGFFFFGGGGILGGPGLGSSGYSARALILRIGFGGIVYCI